MSFYQHIFKARDTCCVLIHLHLHVDEVIKPLSLQTQLATERSRLANGVYIRRDTCVTYTYDGPHRRKA